MTDEMELGQLNQELATVKAGIGRMRERHRLESEVGLKRQRVIDRAALLEGRVIPPCPSRPKGDPCDVCLTGVLAMTGKQCTSQN